ncbi:peroxisome assembly protein 12 [Fopius arisanus]|uniref:Peroxisome assembly protein 12 n=1 Tax=Fopius arisanus TaxID=64838 RepID=A0A9R1SYL1_9HYME|nr:PREDICTED: peroxisome assembly protein 12 [Fopius arisanus]
MAERGAHLTGTALVKPTIFEIVAQESLASTLEPAFKRVFSFLVTCNPERYGWLTQWSDEAYGVFHGLLQRFYLKNYGASFSETFYGLQRIAIVNSKPGGKLSKGQETLSLIFLLLHPYLKAKANQFELAEIDGKIPNEKWKRILKTYFVRAHRIYNFIREISSLYYYLSYISDRSKYPTPLLHLLSMTLTYSHPHELISISELLSKLRQGGFSTSDGVYLLQRGFTRTLELGAFFLQFVNWWNQENFYTNLMSLPVPPPPPVPDIARRYKSLCPVCIKSPNIPTALSVSGYVFCYQCILLTIQTNGKCPVTHYPAKEDDLIRLYN